MPMRNSTIEMMKLFQENFKKDIVSTNLLIQLVEKKLNDCDSTLAAIRQSTRDLNSDFSSMDSKVSKVRRWLRQNKLRRQQHTDESSIIDDGMVDQAEEDDDEDDDEDENMREQQMRRDEAMRADKRNDEELIRRILDYECHNDGGDGICCCDDEDDSSYVNVTIRPDGTATASTSPTTSLNYCSGVDRFSFMSMSSDIDASLASSSFSSSSSNSSSSSGYSTN